MLSNQSSPDCISAPESLCARAVYWAALILVMTTLAGCEPQAKSQPPAAPPAKPQKAPTKSAPPPSSNNRQQSKSPVTEQPSAQQPKPRTNPTLSDLVATA